VRILHINKCQEGGAAWCAKRIHNALIEQGVESRMLVADGEPCDGIYVANKDPQKKFNVIIRSIKRVLRKTPWYFDKERLDSDFYKRNYSLPDPIYIHHPFSDYTNIAHHPLVEWADVIHLHWVPGFVDYPTFFKEVKKPIVWTLHDKYPLVGIQHYCSDFFPIPSHLRWIDKKCRDIKRNGVSGSGVILVIAISEMMKSLCSQSSVMKSFPCRLIHNGVNVDVFRPYNRNNVRKELYAKFGIEVILDQDCIIFMFSAYGIWDRNKGLQRAIDAIEKLKLQNKLLLIVGDNWESKTPCASFPIIETGLVREQTELAKLYSVSNFFLQISYEETFAQTPLESMSCGTPVISTPCSGSQDLIDESNGVICRGFDEDSIYEGICLAMNMVFDSEQIRNQIIKEYNYSKVAKEYMKLYSQLV